MLLGHHVPCVFPGAKRPQARICVLGSLLWNVNRLGIKGTSDRKLTMDVVAIIRYGITKLWS